MSLAENIYEAIHQYTVDLAASKNYCNYVPPTPVEKDKLIAVIQAEIDRFKGQK